MNTNNQHQEPETEVQETEVQETEVHTDTELDFTTGEQELLKARRRSNMAAAIIVAHVTEKSETTVSINSLANYTGSATGFVMAVNNLERLNKAGKISIEPNGKDKMRITIPQGSPLANARAMYANASKQLVQS